MVITHTTGAQEVNRQDVQVLLQVTFNTLLLFALLSNRCYTISLLSFCWKEVRRGDWMLCRHSLQSESTSGEGQLR